MYKLTCLTLFIVSLLSPSLRASISVEDALLDKEEALPKSWWQLPEDQRADEPFDSENYWDDRGLFLHSNAEAAIDRLFSANAEALDEMESQVLDSAVLRHRGKKKWRLEACIFDVTLSATAVPGMLMAKGEASAAIYWRRKAPSPDNVVVADSVPDDATLDGSFSTADSEDAIETRLEPVIKMVMATGQVTDEPALRRNLLGTILDYHVIMQNLNFDSAQKWSVSRLRFDFSIDISGKVNPVTTVGGGVRLRFEWEPTPHSIHFARRKVRNLETLKIGDNLKKLVQDLAREMDAVPFDDVHSSAGFQLKQLKFGLGLFAEGKVGVVKIGGSIFGYLYLSKKSRGSEVAITSDDPPSVIPLIDYTGNSGYHAWAKNHGVPYQILRDRRGPTTVYSLTGEALRKGVARAATIGTRLADRSAQKKRKWEVYQIKTEFALSISGGAALFRLGGTGSIELVFNKV